MQSAIKANGGTQELDPKEINDLQERLTLAQVMNSTDPKYADAQYRMGMRYLKGQEVPKDESEAVKLFQKSAAQGHAAAQYVLGLCHLRGKGVTQNKKKAAKLFKKSAAQGYAAAQNELLGLI